MYKYLFVSFLIVTLFFLSTGKLLADDGTCTPTINNFVIALEKSNCQFIGENQACYGIAEVETFPEKLFTGCGSYVNIFSGLQRIQTNDEGAALLHLRNQHEDLLKVALFGKMRLEGTGGNAYILRARGGNLLCERTQAGALLKTDANRTASIRLNSVTIRLRSAAFVTMDSVVLFDDNPRNNLRTLPNGSRNPNPLFCSGFDSECAFGDKSCPLGYRLVWGPYGRSSSYAYIEDGLYRVTMHGQGRVEAGATDWEPTHQAFSFGSNEFDLAESPSYTFCWRGNQPSSNGFETIILKRSNNAQVNRLTIEYLGPDCSGGQMEALDADFMTVTNLEGTVEVSIQGTVRILQPGEQVRIYFANEIPVVITGPFEAVGIQDSPLLDWLISPVGVPKIQLPEISSITQCGRAITYGDVVNEAIADVGESCSYPFTGQAGDILTIQMSRQTDALDPLLILRDANGRELVENDDIGESNRNSTITNYQLPSTGAYTIVARSYNDASAGAFTLSLTKVEPIACEPPYSTIELGSCTMLRWTVENAQAVYFEGQPVNGRDSREVCPQNSQSYALRVVTDDGDQYCTMNVDVRDSNGPEIVSITSVPDLALSSGRLPPICYEDKVLVDALVIDPSGVAKVQILFWSDSFKAESRWGLPYDMGNIGNDIYEHPSRAGNTIKIRAEDSLGNVSESAEYSIECVNVQTLYNFVSQANDAQWMAYDGNQSWLLHWPGGETDERGFARQLNYAVLEDGSTSSTVLQTHPAWTSYGTIDGQFHLSDITIQESDYFVGKVGFLEGAYAGDVIFHVGFWDGDADSHNEWIFEQTDTYDGQLRNIEFPLASLSGKTGYFTLQVEANGDSSQDWAVWTEARLERR